MCARLWRDESGRPWLDAEKVGELASRKSPALSIVRAGGASQVPGIIGGKGGTRTLDPGIMSVCIRAVIRQLRINPLVQRRDQVRFLGRVLDLPAIDQVLVVHTNFPGLNARMHALAESDTCVRGSANVSLFNRRHNPGDRRRPANASELSARSIARSGRSPT